MNLSTFDYFPMLRPKRGELVALKRLDIENKNKIIPIFDLHMPAFQEREGKYIKSFDKHLDDVFKCIDKNWGNNFFCLDIYSYLSALPGNEKQKNAKAILEKAKTIKFSLVVNSVLSKEHISWFKEILKAQSAECKIILRLEKDEIEDPAILNATIQKCLEQLGIKRNQLVLLFDYKNIEEKEKDSIVDDICNAHESTDFTQFSNIIFSASSFPVDMSGIKKNTVERISRVEYSIWKDLIKRSPLFDEVVIKFSDYGVSHPLKPELDPSMITPAGKIRYTTTDHWIISRGHQFEDNGIESRADQYEALAKKIITEKDFQGEFYCWGDSCILDSAYGGKGYGGLEKWVQIDMNHHFTFVVEQISNILLL